MEFSEKADTVPAAVARAADRFGEATALVDGPVHMTYRDLHGRVRAFARMLLARGIRPAERVAICSPNTYHWVVAALGTLYAGAVVVPINTRYTGGESVDILRRSQARALVVAGEFLGKDRHLDMVDAAGEAGLPSLHTVLRVPVERDEPSRDGVLEWSDIDDAAQGAGAGAVEERAAAVTPDDVSDILFTSGTTGRSKGAMSAHRQALGVARAWAECGEVTVDDRYLVINPFFHSFGYKAGSLVCLLTGATIVPQPVFDIDTLLSQVQRERITVLPGAPTIYQSMLEHSARDEYDLSSLRLAVTGAATVPVALVERMQSELSFSAVITAYGLTEAVVATMCRPGDAPTTVSTTCGRPVSGFELAVVDSSGRALPAETAGEIVLRGPNVMLGYLDDAEATAKAVDPDGWLHTGDVGTVDGAGNLTITDRLKDMYICGGFNVYPAEVEQELARLDGVSDSAVVGIADTRMGEVGKAYIVTRDDAKLTEQGVVDFCRLRLANYKVPRAVEFVSSLPRNPSGKLLKRELRAKGTT